MSSPTEALAARAVAPVSDAPTIVDGDVGVAAELLTADLAGDFGVVRRVRLYNTSATGTITLGRIERGAAEAGVTVANGTKIGPGHVYTEAVSARWRLVVIASEAATTFNATISDA